MGAEDTYRCEIKNANLKPADLPTFQNLDCHTLLTAATQQSKQETEFQTSSENSLVMMPTENKKTQYFMGRKKVTKVSGV